MAYLISSVTFLLLTTIGCVRSSTCFISSSHSYINEHITPLITCFSSCDYVAFQHNNTNVNASSSKYALTVSPNMHAQLTIYNIVPSDSGNYRCVYNCSNQFCYSSSETLAYALPVEFLTPSNITYHEFVGGNVTILCHILHYIEFQWLNMDGNVIAESEQFHFHGTNLIIDDVQVNNANTYRCTASNFLTGYSEIKAILKVYKKPTVEIVGNSTVEVSEGGSVSFTCKAYGVPKPEIVWANDLNLIIGGRIQKTEECPDAFTISSTLNISQIQRNDDGLYKCTAFTSNGSSSETFGLHVLTPQIVIDDEIFINTTSVRISWKLLNIPAEMFVIVSWREVNNTGDTNISYLTLSQNITVVMISLLSPNTSYHINISVADVSTSMIITTNSLLETSISPVNTKQPSSSDKAYSIFYSTEQLIFSSFHSLSTFITVSPSVVNEPIFFDVTIVGIGSTLACIVVAIIFIAAIFGIIFYAKRKSYDRAKCINLQKINQQPTTYFSDDTNLNSQNFEFQEMTHNPRFNEEFASCNVNSSSPKNNKDGYEEFEMTDNPFFNFDTEDNFNSQDDFYTDKDNKQVFHLTENNIYESCATNASTPKLRELQNGPRFEIVSNKRGNIKEKVSLL